jgi:hypothetical protein
MRYKQRVFGRNRSVKNGTLLLKLKQFFVHITLQGVTETPHMALPSHALQAVYV